MSATLTGQDPWGQGSPPAPPARTLNGMGLEWDDAERTALVALLRHRPGNLTWSEITAEVAETGSAREVWSRHVPADLLDLDGSAHPVLLEAGEDVRRWAESPFDFLTFMDDAYPARLRDVHQIPPVIFTRGEMRAEDVGICVVGSRKASADGLEIAERVSEELVRRGLSVVSGLAAGIDAAAHRAALAAGGRTVAVIGTGIERYYPAENRRLQQRIVEEGLVLSQFWPTAPPTKQSFPMRNAVMSAYGHATLVVEAGQTSGARTQARLAVEHGRPVILTRTVVAATTWGRAMADGPGVTVIRTVHEALGAVEQILDAEEQVGRLLSFT